MTTKALRESGVNGALADQIPRTISALALGMQRGYKLSPEAMTALTKGAIASMAEISDTRGTMAILRDSVRAYLSPEMLDMIREGVSRSGVQESTGLLGGPTR